MGHKTTILLEKWKKKNELIFGHLGHRVSRKVPWQLEFKLMQNLDFKKDTFTVDSSHHPVCMYIQYVYVCVCLWYILDMCRNYIAIL